MRPDGVRGKLYDLYERRHEREDSQRVEECRKALEKIAHFSPDTVLVGAELISIRDLDNVQQLKDITPYYQTFGRDSGSYGWTRHNAHGRFPGFSRIYNFHARGLVVRDFLMMLRDPDVQRSCVLFKYHTTENALLEYMRSNYAR